MLLKVVPVPASSSMSDVFDLSMSRSPSPRASWSKNPNRTVLSTAVSHL